MWQYLAQIILRNRVAIISVILLLTGVFAYFAATNLKLDNKYGNMLPKQSPAQSKYLEFKSLFGEDGGTLVFAIKDQNFYTAEKIKKWRELSDRIAQIDGVTNVVSEANLIRLVNDTVNKRFVVERIISDDDFDEAVVKEFERIIRGNPLYEGTVFNSASKVSLMLISVSEDFLSDPKKAGVVIEIESIAEEYESYFGKIHFAGLPHIRVVIAKRIMNEMYIFIGLAILVTSILIFIFFRSLRIVLICNTVVFISVIWSMGSIGMFDFQLSILMALIPPLMIVIGIPNCIFLITKFHREVVEHGNKMKAIQRIITKIGNATFLTNLTTALGFSTFILTDSEKLIQFGIIASMNIMALFILSLTIIPILVSWNKLPSAKHLKHLQNKYTGFLVNRFIHLAKFKRPLVYTITSLVVVISLVGLFRVEATGNLTGDLPQGDPILEDVNFISDNFGGAIPFEIVVNYKEPGRLLSKQTLTRIEEIQSVLREKGVFSKSISIVDLVKFINMSYYGNQTSRYKIISNQDKRFIKPYIDKFRVEYANQGVFGLKELVDTNALILRIRSQVLDLGSYEIAALVKELNSKFDSILNPERGKLEKLFIDIKDKKTGAFDQLFTEHKGVLNKLARELANGDEDLIYAFDSDPELLKTYQDKPEFLPALRNAIDNQYYEFTLTGTSVVAAEGTQYLVKNLLTSLFFAVIIISILMAILFRSWRMVLASLVPNFIPLLATAGVMGFFHIPIKPSTILVFSIAFGISVDDTIHFLAKYRMELKNRAWAQSECVINALKETGLSMFYTSIILFCGFNMFSLSQFGGTKALGMLVSLTLIVAMTTNLVLLPTILLSLHRWLNTKSFQEPYFQLLEEEEDIDLNALRVEINNKE
jgi:predicted RND superfamily exporter protein